MADGGSTACDLTREPFSFDGLNDAGAPAHGACDGCLQANCCRAVVGCFAGNAECRALNSCLLSCVRDCGSGATVGPDGGSSCPYAPKLETVDGGIIFAVSPYDQCVDACRTAHPSLLDVHDVFDRCYVDTCASSCTANR